MSVLDQNDSKMTFSHVQKIRSDRERIGGANTKVREKERPIRSGIWTESIYPSVNIETHAEGRKGYFRDP